MAVEAAFHFGFPLDAKAILLIEVDGLEVGLDEQRDGSREICTAVPGLARCGRLATPKSGSCSGNAANRRLAPWAGLAPAIARRTASCRGQSCRTSLRRITEIGGQIRRANRQRVSCRRRQHSPDPAVRRTRSAGNRRVLAASGEILDECIAFGGSVTGEHGIGVEKISFMHKLFTPTDLDAMDRLRGAFNPDDRLSPGKMLPTAGACGLEQKHPGRRAAL